MNTPLRKMKNHRPCPLVREVDAPNTIFEVYCPSDDADILHDCLPLRTLDNVIVPSKHHSKLKLVKVVKAGDIAMVTAKTGQGLYNKFGWVVELAEDPVDGHVDVWAFKRKDLKKHRVALDCL
jgi:hypothetical protein